MTLCKDAENNIINQRNGILNRRQDHFEDLLNVQDNTHGAEPKPGGEDVLVNYTENDKPTFEKVERVMARNKNSKHSDVTMLRQKKDVRG